MATSAQREAVADHKAQVSVFFERDDVMRVHRAACALMAAFLAGVVVAHLHSFRPVLRQRPGLAVGASVLPQRVVRAALHLSLVRGAEHAEFTARDGRTPRLRKLPSLIKPALRGQFLPRGDRLRASELGLPQRLTMRYGNSFASMGARQLRAYLGGVRDAPTRMALNKTERLALLVASFFATRESRQSAAATLAIHEQIIRG